MVLVDVINGVMFFLLLMWYLHLWLTCSSEQDCCTSYSGVRGCWWLYCGGKIEDQRPCKLSVLFSCWIHWPFWTYSSCNDAQKLVSISLALSEVLSSLSCSYASSLCAYFSLSLSSFSVCYGLPSSKFSSPVRCFCIWFYCLFCTRKLFFFGKSVSLILDFKMLALLGDLVGHDNQSGFVFQQGIPVSEFDSQSYTWIITMWNGYLVVYAFSTVLNFLDVNYHWSLKS